MVYTNVLLRQYFPRGSDRSAYSQAQRDLVELHLNQRKVGSSLNRGYRLHSVQLFGWQVGGSVVVSGKHIPPNELAQESIGLSLLLREWAAETKHTEPTKS